LPVYQVRELGCTCTALSREDRIKAILTAMSGEQGPTTRAYFAGVVAAGRGGFRASTVQKWPKEELA
jgi:hypothetical protein